MLNDKVNELTNSGQKVRLHLGCGSRLFDGYINIDGEYMQGTPGITIHDLLNPFPLPENCVD